MWYRELNSVTKEGSRVVGGTAGLLNINELMKRKGFGCIHPEHKLHKSAHSNSDTWWHISKLTLCMSFSSGDSSRTGRSMNIKGHLTMTAETNGTWQWQVLFFLNWWCIGAAEVWVNECAKRQKVHVRGRISQSRQTSITCLILQEYNISKQNAL